MSEVSQVQIEEVLQRYSLPHLNQNVLDADVIRRIDISGDRVDIRLELGFPVASIQLEQQAAIEQSVQQIDGVNHVKVAIDWVIPSIKAQRDLPNMEQVKNIIAVASGKGGVGKSTTSVNLALALHKEGAKVGLLDADIYGPSQPLMLGISDGQRPGQYQQKYFLPIEAHGLKTMSMGYLVTDKTPMVWRGPMAGGALNQLLTQTWWGDLDYLIIDMPPGTGDIQLTLSQKAVVAGAVIVTTPQDIALLDARKGIEMFNKVDVPVLGVVENMSTHICSQCGHVEPIFGDAGGARIAQEYAVPLLAQMPLSLKVRQHVDEGAPTVVAEPESDEAILYGAMARNVAAQLSQQLTAGNTFPEISISDD